MSSPSLVSLLSDRAQSQGDRLAFAHLVDGVEVGESWTYGDLYLRAASIGAELRSMVRPGSRALLLYPAGLDFLAGFFGCLCAGVVAIPAPPPEASRLKRTGPRLRAIAADSKAEIVLTTSTLHELMAGGESPIFEPGSLHWLMTDRDAAAQAGGSFKVEDAPDALAYLQYTSGSTSTPKGVMLSHRSVCFHLENLRRFGAYTSDSVTVSWMPYFHDYGLVEGLLEPLYNATPCYVMSPFSFIKRPLSWLGALTRFRGTHSQAPNFAYDHCVRRIPPQQREGLDLRCWRNAGNAAEPINPKVMVAFHEAFRASGFLWGAFCPAYGLAEATLLVSSSPSGRDPLLLRFDTSALEAGRAVVAEQDGGHSRILVGCGRIFESAKVRIVDPATSRVCRPEEIGEIWVSDEAVADGYWQRPEETEQTFRAFTAEPREGPFLRTGDLGFLRDGDLFISGRLKDLIIIRGTNHYPQDIEWTVQSSHPAFRPENGAAFSVVIDGQERLVVAQEVEREAAQDLQVDPIATSVRQAVAEEHEIDLFALLLLRRGSLPKTASGKIQRQDCRGFFLRGGPEVVGGWIAPVRSPDGIPAWLRRPAEGPPPTGPTPATSPSNGRDRDGAGSEGTASRRKADGLIDWLRSYAGERINSRLMDERRCVPPYIILDMGNRGVMGLQVPESYGGLGLRHTDTFRVLGQIAAIDLNLAAVIFLHNTNGVRPIQNHATPELRDEMLPLLARGRELAAFALSEPEAGSNVGGIKSLALPRPDGGWKLRGFKRWNAASWAGIVSVFVRVVQPDGRVGGMAGFAVRQGTPGFRIGPEALTTGLRGSVQTSITLQDVPVSARELLGELGRGMEVADDALMAGRLCTAAVSIGAMRRCALLMSRYAGRRIVATGPLIDNPVTLVRLGELTARITVLDALLQHVAGALDRGLPVAGEVAMCVKILASDGAVWAAGDLMQVLGGRGYMENNIAPQILRDARVLTVGEGPNETLGWYVGRSVSQTRSIQRFISQSLDAPEVADRLEADLAELSDRCMAPGSPFADRSATLCWSHSLVGGLAADGLMLAAAERLANGAGSPIRGAVAAWARLRYEESVRAANRAARGEPQIAIARGASEFIASCIEAIGDVEQDLPGEERDLDPLLRRRPGRSPGGQPAGLPGDLGLVPPAGREGSSISADSAGSGSESSRPSKRDLLEQALRDRIRKLSDEQAD